MTTTNFERIQCWRKLFQLKRVIELGTGGREGTGRTIGGGVARRVQARSPDREDKKKREKKEGKKILNLGGKHVSRRGQSYQN